jgi:uncharacterized membrane protein
METENSSSNLETITRIVLVFGIIFILGGIIYQTTRPEETDLLFFLLNENQEMRNYPTNTTLENPVGFHIYLENQLNNPYDFAVRVYVCENSYNIDTLTTVYNTSGAHYIENQTIQLNDKQQWISDQFEISFNEVGENQIIIVELWQKIGNVWLFIPDYMLIFRISVF